MRANNATRDTPNETMRGDSRHDELQDSQLYKQLIRYHEMLDGRAIHESDNVYGNEWQSKKGFWYVTSHCKICGTPMSKPIKAPKDETSKMA